MSATALQIGFIATPLTWARWPVARAMLTPALTRGDLAWPDVEAELTADTMQLVAIQKGGGLTLLAVAVIRTALTPIGEVLEIVAAAGRNFRIWAAWGMSALQNAARDAGMAGVQLTGRRGWRRVFPDMARDGDMLTVGT